MRHRKKQSRTKVKRGFEIESAKSVCHADQRMCLNKKRYDTELQAIHACIGSSASYRKLFRWYRCPRCHKWHVTSKIRS